MKSFSLVIIIKDDYKFLECALRSLENANYPKSHFEVLVIDDGSSVPIERSLRFKPSFTLKLFYLPRTATSSRAKARNHGAREAAYDYLIFIDGDHFVGPAFLERYSRYFEYKRGRKIVLGTRRHIQEHSWRRILSSFESTEAGPNFDAIESGADERQLLQDFMGCSFSDLHGRWHLFCSCNFCIEKETFFSIGMFDESFIGWGLEDVELGYRLFAQNYSFELLESPVWHFLKKNPVTKDRYSEWMRNIQVFYQKYNDVRILHQLLIEPTFFYGGSQPQDKRTCWFSNFKEFEIRIRAMDTTS